MNKRKLIYMGAQPYKNKKEMKIIIKDIKEEFRNKVKIDIDHNDKLITYEYRKRVTE
ncbi:hypothetical protein [Halalkalibacter oceani]|uniref:hypothetical protein n=1 Tax=Halalkalibacter oceani TaxID=1653776 RepID=UPI0033964123